MLYFGVVWSLDSRWLFRFSDVYSGWRRLKDFGVVVSSSSSSDVSSISCSGSG